MAVQKPPQPDDKKKSPFLTTGEKVPNYLWIALIAALFLHALATPFFPNLAKPHETTKVDKVSVAKKAPIKVPTPPPPTPTPPPTKATPPPQQTPTQPKLKVNVVKSHNTGRGPSITNNNPKTGTETGVPKGQGTASPSPTVAPTQAPACAVPFKDATVNQVSAPNYPSSAQDAGFGSADVPVVVTLSASGSVISVKLVQSSGNFAIDREAKRAARDTTYYPKIVNCKPVASQYIFDAQFQPD